MTKQEARKKYNLKQKIHIMNFTQQVKKIMKLLYSIH